MASPLPVPAPQNPVVLATQAQWLFTDEELTRAPSQLDGMKWEAEQMSRSKGVNFITQVGIMLKLPQLTIATAAVYLHRFFMRYSMVNLPNRPGMHHYPIAATSLFLATKVEENVRRMREIIVACCRVAQKQPNLVVDEQSKEFWKWRDTILLNEDTLLEALCFDLHLEQPYRILYDFLVFLKVSDNKAIRNASWAFLNDSMFTVLCLQFPARTIAAAALYAAAQHCDLAFEDDAYGQPWWDQVDVDITDVRRACTRMAQLYESNATQRHSPNYPTTPIIADESTGVEKTRIPHSGSPAVTPSALVPESAGHDAVNGRKRSRESGEDSRGPSPEHHSQTQTQYQGEGMDERSPKRPRMGSSEAGSTEKYPSSASASFHSSGPPPSSSAHDRQHINGHSHPQHQHHLYPHPPGPAARPPPRRDSDTRPSGGDGPSDPIQQRIDQIVQQNMSSHGGPPRDRDRERGRERDSERDRGWDRDRDHDRERGRERRPPVDRYRGDRKHPPAHDEYDSGRRRSYSARRRSSVEEPYHYPQHQHQHQHRHEYPHSQAHIQAQTRGASPPAGGEVPPPPQPPSQPPPPIYEPSREDDEGGGSEEGEL